MCDLSISTQIKNFIWRTKKKKEFHMAKKKKLTIMLKKQAQKSKKKNMTLYISHAYIKYTIPSAL